MSAGGAQKTSRGDGLRGFREGNRIFFTPIWLPGGAAGRVGGRGRFLRLLDIARRRAGRATRT